jgi:predicted nucleic acid-binding protein
MAAAAPFVDTDVLIYLLSADAAKADRAEALLAEGATIGVQVLNEVVAVARRKLAMPWHEIDEFLGLVSSRCRVLDLTRPVHRRALEVARRHRLSWYDALIVGAALEAGCALLYSADMRDGAKIGPTLTIRNPFAR